ncbi:hypothetical protein BLNAU_18716 [Blattamonas nauphoetae]|uniref:Amino acid transporter transmembrane domain-containing protein n=1 Tax=Blattamonas nauphoetae TaxID=2049346 RepID=A0ABQ9X3K2_9EUKA|nr:hypothetical protein BLNAU_18716 [Blattamonas nauphoetae]
MPPRHTEYLTILRYVIDPSLPEQDDGSSLDMPLVPRSNTYSYQPSNYLSLPTVLASMFNSAFLTAFFTLSFNIGNTGLLLSIFGMFLALVTITLSSIWILESTARLNGFHTAQMMSSPQTESMNKLSHFPFQIAELFKQFVGPFSGVLAMIVVVFKNLMIVYRTYNQMIDFIESVSSLFDWNVSTVQYFTLIITSVLMMLLNVIQPTKIVRLQVIFSIIRFIFLAMCIVLSIYSISVQGAYPLSGQSFSDPKFYFSTSGFLSLFSQAALSLHASDSLTYALHLLKPKQKLKANWHVFNVTLFSAIIFIIAGLLLALAMDHPSIPSLPLNFLMFTSKGFTYRNFENDNHPPWYAWFFALFTSLVQVLNAITTTPFTVTTSALNIIPFLPQQVSSNISLTIKILGIILVILPTPLIIWDVNSEILEYITDISTHLILLVLPAIAQLASKRKSQSEWKTPYSGVWSRDIFPFLSIAIGTVLTIATAMSIVERLVFKI